MNKYNNYSTLNHYKGSIWITKIDEAKENQGINICLKTNDDYNVLCYVIKSKKGYTFNHNKYYSLDDIVYSFLESYGTLWMLEDRATCQVCNKSFLETDINMIDYELDVCTQCEKTIK